MILSNILIKMKVTKYIKQVFKPLFGIIFGVSAEGSYPILIGFLCRMSGRSKRQRHSCIKKKDIGREEAQYLLTFCNNLSPMFLIEFIGVKCLDVKRPFLVLAVAAGSAIINARLYRVKVCKEKM